MTRISRKTPTKAPLRATKLTLKQEAFVTWYVSAEVNGNGTEAARRAHYAGNDQTLAVVAAENLRKPYIRAEIDRRVAQIMTAAHVTVEQVLRDLDVIKSQALAAGQYGAAARCAGLQGRYLQMFVDRKDVKHSGTVALEPLGLSATARWLEETVGAGAEEPSAQSGAQ